MPNVKQSKKTGRFEKNSTLKLRSNFSEDNFNYKDSYWSGFLMAEGCIQKSGQLQVCLGIKDIDHLNLLRKYICPKMNLGNYGNRCSIQITHSEIKDNLEKLNIRHGKTNEILVIPNTIKNNEEFHSHYIRGLFDGDGWIYFKKNKYISHNIGFCSHYEKSIDNIIELIPKKYHDYIAIHNKSNQKLTELRIYKRKILQNFFQWLYFNSSANLRLKRKYDISQKIMKLNTDKCH